MRVYVDYQPIVLVERNLLLITDFPVLREDTFTGDTMRFEICLQNYSVKSIEPNLTPLAREIIPSGSNKSDEALLDIAAREFWDREQNAFFDVRIFNPFAQKHLNQSLNIAFNQNEREKKGNIINALPKLNVDRLHQ